MATLRLKNGSTKIIKAGTLVRYNPADKKSFIATSLEDADVIGVLSTSTAPNGVGVIDLLGASTGTGTTGINGKSAYELAVEGGFVGNVGAWLLSLKGKDGKDGLKGNDGSNGHDGYTPIKGVDYFDGTNATITKSAVEAVLTGEISSHTHAGSGLTQQQIMRLQ